MKRIRANVEHQVMDSLLKTDFEFTSRIAEDAADLLIGLGYLHFLKRDPDESGLTTNKEMLKTVDQLPLLIKNLVLSDEAKEKSITGLDLARFLAAAATQIGGQGEEFNQMFEFLAGEYLSDPEALSNPLVVVEQLSNKRTKKTGPLLASCWEADSSSRTFYVFALRCSQETIKAVTGKTAIPMQEDITNDIALIELDYPDTLSEVGDVLFSIAGHKGAWLLSSEVQSFRELLDETLETKMSDLIDFSVLGDAPRVSSKGSLVDDTIAILYQTMNGLVIEPGDREQYEHIMLNWYLNAWPEHVSCLGKLALSDEQLAYASQDAVSKELLGYSLNKHIFFFAKSNDLLDIALRSQEGLFSVYEIFLRSKSYRHFSGNDIIPSEVLSALNASVWVNGFVLNRFWKSVFEHEMGVGQQLQNFPVHDLQRVCAEKMCYSVANNLFGTLIPPEWFRLYKKGLGGKLNRGKVNGAPLKRVKEEIVVIEARKAVRAILHDASLEEIFGDGWIEVGRKAKSKLDKVGDDSGLITVIGHKGGSGLAKTVPMFREAFTNIGVKNKFLDVDGMSFVDQITPSEPLKVNRDITFFAVNADRYSNAAVQFAASAAHRKGAVSIGSFFWETSRAPQIHRLAGPLLDEVWASTEFIRKIYLELFDGKVNVVKTGMSISVPDSIPPYPLPNLGIRTDDFVFLNVSDFDSSIKRKNPLPVVQAFRKAFPKDPHAKLILKIRKINRDHWSNTNNYWDKVLAAIGGDQRIKILHGDLPESDYWALLKSVDCYVTLHRGEGFGYGAAHAMVLGIPVISTDYSGTQDFCTSKTSLLVQAKEIPVPIGDMPFREDLGSWAEPDVESASQQMTTARSGGKKVKGLISNAKDLMENAYSPHAFESRIKSRLDVLGN